MVIVEGKMNKIEVSMKKDKIFYLATFLIVFLIISCKTFHAPPQYLPTAKQAQSDVYGGWIEVKTNKGNIYGELIAIQEKRVFVADLRTLHEIDLEDIISARLVTYNSESSKVFLHTAGGIVFTLGLAGWIPALIESPGGEFFEVILWMLVSPVVVAIWTTPMWVIIGTGAAIYQSNLPIIDYPKKPLDAFIPFARFPQGIPPDVDKNSIRMKIPKKEMK
jgi:hypothetical protein